MGRRQYIDQCMEEAHRSDLHFQHGAVLIKNNKVIGKGFNKYTGHKLHHLRSVHAEMKAIQNAGNTDIENAVMYVIRLSNLTDDGLGSSCPCTKCTKFMKLHKIQKVIYSTGQGLVTRYVDEL
jgi:tRNA(Arg) A34 adenosine deaminase TadA